MRTCSVKGCRKRRPTKTLKLYSLPKNPEYQKQWIDFCDLKKTLSIQSARICSRHFEKKFIVKRPIDVALGLDSPPRYRNLAENAVPTLFPPSDSGEQNETDPEDENSAATSDATMKEDLEITGVTSVNKDSQNESQSIIFKSDPVSEPIPEVVYITQAATNTIVTSHSMETDTATTTVPLMTFHSYALPPMNHMEVQEREILPSTCRQTSSNLLKKPKEKKIKPAVLNEQVSFSSSMPAQKNAKNDSNYMMVKRSVWNSTMEKAMQFEAKSNQVTELEAKYIKSLEAVQILNQRLTVGEDLRLQVLTTLKEQNEALAKELLTLKQDRENLKKRTQALTRDKEKLEERFKIQAVLLKQYFTTGQLRRLFSDDLQARARWGPEDISQALTLKNESIAAYRFLQDKYAFLLPDLRTLRRWVKTKKLQIDEKVENNPEEPLNNEDQVAANLILLHEQTSGEDQEDDEEDVTFTVTL